MAIYASSDVTIGFNTSSLMIQPAIKSFSIDILAFSGGSNIAAGEFNISYPSDYINLVGVEGYGNWTVNFVSNKFIFYTLTIPSNKTTIATLHFNIKPIAKNKTFDVKLELFRAADRDGNDLNIVFHNGNIKITVLKESFEDVEKPVSMASSWEATNLILLTFIGISSVILVTSFYIRKKRIKFYGYYLIDQRGKIVFRCDKPDRVYGREDFSNLLDPPLLQYLTRRSKGGQFRILRVGNQYYIMDQYSMNPTIVDGIEIKGKGRVHLRDGSMISVHNVFNLIFKSSLY
jgi:hypothetical protein